MSTVTERPILHYMPDNAAPFAFLMHAAARGVETWKPEYGVTLSAETLQAAGVHRLASKHPGGVRFVEKRFHNHAAQ